MITLEGHLQATDRPGTEDPKHSQLFLHPSPTYCSCPVLCESLTELLLALRDASLSGEMCSSARGSEGSRKSPKAERQMVLCSVVLRVWGQSFLRRVEESHQSGHRVLTLCGSKPIHGDSDGLSPPVAVYEAIASIGRRAWKQITEGDRNQIFLSAE